MLARKNNIALRIHTTMALRIHVLIFSILSARQESKGLLTTRLFLVLIVFIAFFRKIPTEQKREGIYSLPVNEYEMGFWNNNARDGLFTTFNSVLVMTTF